MICYEDQARDKLKVDPLVARAFLNQVLEHMKPTLDATGIKRDGLDVAGALQKVSEQSGLSIDTVAKIIKADGKLYSISKQAFNRTREANAVKAAATNIAEKGVPQTGNITRVYNDIRRLALAGHSPVFPFTHARNLLYGSQAERGIFTRMVRNAWGFRGETGDAAHDAAIAKDRANPNYKLKLSAGLDIKEGTQKGDILRPPESGTILSKKIDEFSKAIAGSKLGQFLRLDPNNAVKAFDALKIGRSELFDHYWDSTPPELKTEAYAQQLAQDMNYATGSITTPRGEAATPFTKLVSAASDATGNVLLSSKMFYGKRMEAANILRYGPARLKDMATQIAQASPDERMQAINIFKDKGAKLSELLSKGGTMTPEERAIANLGLKRWARISATQIGILGANLAFAKAMGLKLPNMTDPTKADYGRLRIGNFVVPLSPLVEAVREPVRAVATATAKRSAYEGAKELTRPVVNALTPGLQLTIEQATGKEPFSSRVVPSVRNVIQPPKPGKQSAVTPSEYVATRFSPIAISGGVREFYQALRSEGVSAPLATAFIKGAAGAATSGLAGTHIYEEEPKQPKVSLPKVQ